jgi:hypothetical protein
MLDSCMNNPMMTQYLLITSYVMDHLVGEFLTLAYMWDLTKMSRGESMNLNRTF